MDTRADDTDQLATLVLDMLNRRELTPEDQSDLCTAAVRALDAMTSSPLDEPLATLADSLVQAAMDAGGPFDLVDAHIRLRLSVKSYCMAAMALRADTLAS